MENIRLSQCMIVKDEEENIRRALSWGKDAVWEQIVVDTGSSDRTAEIAGQMGARVYHFPWRDDFSAAKNFAIQQAKGDWIAFLDADEYLDGDSAGRLLSVLARAQKEAEGTGRPASLQSCLINLDDERGVISSAVQERFFQRDPRIYYQNPIHEELSPGRYVCKSAREEVVIWHTGYQTGNRQKKSRRNRRILEQELTQNGPDIRVLAYLGDALTGEGLFEKARAHYQNALELGARREKGLSESDKLFLAHARKRLMKLYTGEFREAERESVRRLYRNCKGSQGADPDLEYLYGTWLYQDQELDEARKHLEKGIAQMESYQGVDDLYLRGAFPQACAMAADCCARVGRPQEAVRYAVMALQVDRYQFLALTVLLSLFREEPVGAVEDFLWKIYSREDLKDLMLLWKGAQETGFEVFQQLIEERLPGEALKRLRREGGVR